jgi:hypothetical protein
MKPFLMGMQVMPEQKTWSGFVTSTFPDHLPALKSDNTRPDPTNYLPTLYVPLETVRVRPGAIGADSNNP